MKFVNVDAESLTELAKKFDVVSVPTVIVFKNGAEQKRIVGNRVADLTTTIKALSSPTTPGSGMPVAPGKEFVDLNTRLHALINQAPVMLFMKGSPDQPRCQFSRRVIDMLKNIDAQFDHFDILSDNDVREGLKAYSDWPTYPQLYYQGNLVGGHDAIEEMANNGELAAEIGMK